MLTTSPTMLDAAAEVVFLADGVVQAIGTHAALMHSSRGDRECVTRELEEVFG